MISERGLHLVDTQTHQEAQGHRKVAEMQILWLKVAVSLLDAVLETLPEDSPGCLRLVEAVDLAERVKQGLL